MRWAAPEGEFRFWEHLDDPFQVPPRRLAVLRDLQVPIRQGVERKDDVLRRMARLGAETVNGQLRAGQVFEVFGLDLGDQQLAFDVGGKPVELLADFGDGLDVMALLLLGLRDRIGRPGDRRLGAAVVRVSQTAWR